MRFSLLHWCRLASFVLHLYLDLFFSLFFYCSNINACYVCMYVYVFVYTFIWENIWLIFRYFFSFSSILMFLRFVFRCKFFHINLFVMDTSQTQVNKTSGCWHIWNRIVKPNRIPNRKCRIVLSFVFLASFLCFRACSSISPLRLPFSCFLPFLSTFVCCSSSCFFLLFPHFYLFLFNSMAFVCVSFCHIVLFHSSNTDNCIKCLLYASIT